jgi:hypothetical protein
MLVSPGSEPVRKANKIRFVYGVQYLDRRTSCMILSSSAVTPSGLCRPSAFGIYTLRTGFARYAPRFSLFGKVLKIPLQFVAKGAGLRSVAKARGATTGP